MQPVAQSELAGLYNRERKKSALNNVTLLKMPLHAGISCKTANETVSCPPRCCCPPVSCLISTEAYSLSTQEHN